jgi:serine/threonine protein phosphatase PrpC
MNTSCEHPARTEEPHVTFDIAAMTHPGRVRRDNQDCALALGIGPQTAVLAVADGVGGLPDGALASQETIAAVREAAATLAEDVDPGEWLARAVAVANVRVHAICAERGEPIASTLVVAVVRGSEAWVANVGDSRGYLLQDGRATQVTRDHVLSSRGGEADESAPITRAIGPLDAMAVDIFGPLSLAPGDALLLCSDGLYRMVDDAALTQIAAGSNVDAACARLVDAANAAGGYDNVAVAICRVGGAY